jgi:hypothetical protein
VIFLGSLDDVRIYNRALAQGEIQQLYKLGTYNVAHSNTVAVSNGLVGYWPLDGSVTNWTTSKTDDVSRTGNTGQIKGMSTTTSPIIGKIGSALKFDGANSYVQIDDNSSLKPTSAVTVSAWVKLSSLTSATTCGASANTDPFIVFKQNSRTGNFEGYSLQKGSTGFGFNVTDSGGTAQDSASVTITPAVGQWYHLVGTFQRPNLAIYLNGVLRGKATHDFDLDYGTLPVFIGRSGGCKTSQGIGTTDWDTYFPGTIDDVRIYNRAITAGEVQQLYHTGQHTVAHSDTTAFSNGLVGYWPFDGPTIDWKTNTFKDISGNGNDATSTGMSTTTSPVYGEIGQALLFNGTSSSVQINANVKLKPAEVTAAAWIKLNSDHSLRATGGANTQYEFVFWKSNSRSGIFTGFDLIENGGYVSFQAASASGVEDSADSANVVQVGKWYHVVGTFKRPTLSVYVNGVLAGTATHDFDLDYDNCPLSIGNVGSPCGGRGYDSWFNGTIDDARIYNRALSAGEVAQLYNAGR